MFSGKVISKAVTSNFDSLGVKTTGDPAKIYFFNPTAVIKIKIDKIYKGQPISDTLTILTPTNVESCGYYFEVNQKYIVYAKTTDDLVIKQNLERKTLDNKTFWTNHCTRTQNWNENEENEIIREIK